MSGTSHSKTVTATANAEYMMGIDEAGRGPVLGPMVYATSFCKLEDLEKVKKFGVADSKALNDNTRNTILKKMEGADFIHSITRVIHASELSNKMLRRCKYNLNLISHDAAIHLINEVLRYLKENHKDAVLKEVYIDTVGDPAKYQSKLSILFPNLEIVVSKKADSLFPIVSAASIVAKVTRDNLLAKWDYIETDIGASKEFGSGYPADPTTKKWLNKHKHPIFGFPTVVRFSWATTEKLLADSPGITKIDWSDDDEDEEEDYAKNKKKRDDYFAERQLSVVDDSDF